MYNPIDDMANKPSNLSIELADMLVAVKEKNRPSMFKFLGNLKAQRKYDKEHIRIKEFVKTFEPRDSISELKEQFQEIASFIADCDLVIAYAHAIVDDRELKIMSKEDQRKLYLHKLYHKEISYDDFRNKFGHYAEKPFEIADRRYSEYDDKELLKIAEKIGSECDKVILEDYDDDNLYPVYIALREELRYCALLVVAGLRKQILKISEGQDTDNFFDKSFDDLVKLESDK